MLGAPVSTAGDVALDSVEGSMTMNEWFVADLARFCSNDQVGLDAAAAGVTAPRGMLEAPVVVAAVVGLAVVGAVLPAWVVAVVVVSVSSDEPNRLEKKLEKKPGEAVVAEWGVVVSTATFGVPVVASVAVVAVASPVVSMVVPAGVVPSTFESVKDSECVSTLHAVRVSRASVEFLSSIVRNWKLVAGFFFWSSRYFMIIVNH